jgi:serine/threonine protein kinase
MTLAARAGAVDVSGAPGAPGVPGRSAASGGSRTSGGSGTPGWQARFTEAVRVDGSSGVATFHARDRDSGRPVLIKVADRTSPRARDGLIREAQVLALVGAHPNIHTMYERAAASGAGIALIFERCTGSFAETFAHHVVPAQHAVALGIKLAGALETMHRAGFAHAAVNPANVLLSEWSEPVLANLAAAVPVQGTWGTVDAPTVHTAPEVLLGEEIGPATDVYGLASVLYLLVAGRSAIVASGGSAAASVSASVLCSSVAPVVHADVPLDLSDLLVWSLASDPLSRCPSAIWFGAELRRIEKSAGWNRTPMPIGAAAR